MKTSKDASVEVAALVQHVELHRAGWWDKTIQRLTLAAIWLSGHTASEEQIEQVFRDEFRCSIGGATIRTSLESLRRQNLLVQLPNGSWRIPETVRTDLEREIVEAEAVEANARESFAQCVNPSSVDGSAIWSAFTSKFLGPLISQTGASTYHLLVLK